MSTVKAYYDGRRFVPIEPVAVRKGRIINLQIVSEETEEARTAARLAAFIQLTDDIHETNKTDPLPPEFDEIMGKRVNFARDLGL